MNEQEDKIALTRRRAELVATLGTPLSADERVRTQGELSIVNAKIKAINTTTAAQLKADADRRKVAGLAQSQADLARARTKIGHTLQRAAPNDDENEDDDPGQTAAVDAWIDALLLRHDIDFARGGVRGTYLKVINDPKRRPPMEQKLAAAIELLVAGVYAAARGQELPQLPSTPSSRTTKPTPAPKSKKR